MLRARLLLLLFAVLPACNSPQWHAEVYANATFQDVYDIAYYTIRDTFEVERADPEVGLIESRWNYDAFAPSTRMPARERVIAEVESVDDGVQLKVRVQRQQRDPRIGYLGYDDENPDDWSEAADDVERAAVVFQKIRSTLRAAGPSSAFLSRPLLLEDAP